MPLDRFGFCRFVSTPNELLFHNLHIAHILWQWSHDKTYRTCGANMDGMEFLDLDELLHPDNIEILIKFTPHPPILSALDKTMLSLTIDAGLIV
jgi:hypothetical protein